MVAFEDLPEGCYPQGLSSRVQAFMMGYPERGSYMERTKRRVLIADSALLMVALFWGYGFVAMKDGLDSFPIFWLTALRFTSAFAIMLTLFWRKLARVTFRELKAGLMIGTLLFLGFVAQTLALEYTTVGKVAFLTTVYVVLVPFLSWFYYKRSPGVTAFIASLVCIAGMGLLSLDSGMSFGLGEGLTLACAIFFALHLLLIEHSMKDMDAVVISAVQIGVVAIYSLAGALLFETWPEQISSTSVWSIGFSSLFCTVLAFLIQTNAQKFTPSTHTAILLSLESVFGAIFGVILLGDPLTLKITAGFALILAAVLITELTPFLKRIPRRSKSRTSATVLE